MTENQNATAEQKPLIIISDRIKELYNSGLNNSQIRQQLKDEGIIKSSEYISAVICRIKKRLEQPQNAIIEQQQAQEEYLRIEIKENDSGDLILFIKTNKEFEDYLKATKEVRTTKNLFNTIDKQEKKFYYMNFDSLNYYFDNINSSIIQRQLLNAGILRIVGISEGLSFNLKDLGVLMTPEQLNLCLKKFRKVYNDFYVRNILNQRIEITAVLK